MKKKNSMLAIMLLLAVVVLGVGYAAAAGPWVINGTAKAAANDGFDVDFTSVDKEDIAAIESDTVGTMTVTLTEVGDSEDATFTLTNNSPKGIGAEIDPNSITVTYNNGADASDYFLVEYELGSETIASDGGTTTLKVTVTLKQAALAEVTETFKVSIGTIEAVQE